MSAVVLKTPSTVILCFEGVHCPWMPLCSHAYSACTCAALHGKHVFENFSHLFQFNAQRTQRNSKQASLAFRVTQHVEENTASHSAVRRSTRGGIAAVIGISAPTTASTRCQGCEWC